MSKKSILHIVNIYFVLPYFIGDQFLYLNEKGYDVHVICSPSEHLKAYSIKNKFKYKEIPILRSFSIIQDIKSIISICKYIKRNDIEIVVGHTPKGALLAMTAAFFMNVPKRIYFRHGLVYETSYGFKRKLLTILEKLTAKLSTKIVCVSPSIYQKSIKDKLNSSIKQIVLGKGTCGGIDSLKKFNPDCLNVIKQKVIKELLNIKPQDFIIGYCGRLVKDKGIIELVNAFKIINKNGHYKLLLVGDFEERDALPIEIIREIENNKDIIKTGFIYNDIEYYYSIMNIFILPSFREGFGMCVIEASSMKIPILTTQVTGCIDSIIENKTGNYILNTSQSIQDSILKLQNSNELLKYGINGREFVLKNFDYQVMWPIIVKEIYS
jgi:glycosyltransferase involved in cell wall biosynthesis